MRPSDGPAPASPRRRTATRAALLSAGQLADAVLLPRRSGSCRYVPRRSMARQHVVKERALGEPGKVTDWEVVI